MRRTLRSLRSSVSATKRGIVSGSIKALSASESDAGLKNRTHAEVKRKRLVHLMDLQQDAFDRVWRVEFSPRRRELMDLVYILNIKDNYPTKPKDFLTYYKRLRATVDYLNRYGGNWHMPGKNEFARFLQYLHQRGVIK